MKNNPKRRILWILLAIVLTVGLAITALATVLAGDVSGDGKITVFDAQMAAEAAAGRRTLTEEQLARLGELTPLEIFQLVINGEITDDTTGTTEPTAIASVTTGDETALVYTVDELTAAVDASGNTQIKLLQDISNDTAVTLPYSCTIDFNGYTLTTNLSSGNCLNITAAGSDNDVTTLKNGTMVYHTLGVRINAGGIVVDNMTMQGLSGAAVGIYDTTDYTSVNRIENSTLSSGAWGCVSFNVKEADFSSTGITILNSTLIAHKTTGANIFVKGIDAIPGTVTLGANVKLYSYNTSIAVSGYTLAGQTLTQTETATASAQAGNVVYTAMNLWTTPEQIGTSAPTEASIAKVVNGQITTYVESVADMVSSVSYTGNTEITLLQDISTTATITLPYSCTLDFDGHTVSTNPQKGNGLQITAAGTEKKITTVKNGTLIHYVVGVRVNEGAVVVENMQISSLSGPCVAIYDGTDYSSVNRITGSTLSSPYTCVAFNKADVDFRNTGITVDNSELISHGTSSRVFLKNSASGTYRIGNIHFGDNVNLYSYAAAPTADNYALYSGTILNKAPETATVTANGVTYEGITRWGTDVPISGTKILAIGNSFCYRLVQELYGIAQAEGQEIFMTNLYYAGCSVEQHWTWLQNETPNYEYWITNSMGRWRQTDITTINAALEFQDWDVITLQQHFSPGRTVNYETALASCTPYTKNLYDYLKTEHPNAELYWHQTWAYAVGYPTTSDTKTIGTVEEQNNQQEQIIAVSAYLSQENGVDQIPCGEAWKIARNDPLITEDPCLSDLCHDGSTTGGQYLNACVWYETLFGESCVGNTWRPGDYTLDETLVAQLQAAAHQAVADMYGEDYAQ